MAVMLGQYPKAANLNGHPVKIRPLARADEAALLDFFQRLPLDERRMLKDDVTDPKVVASWCKTPDYTRVLPLLALEGSRIVGDATLHFSRSGWSPHVAKVRVTIDASWRGRGLGRALVAELLEIATAMKVAIVDAEMMAGQKNAVKLFEGLGFVAVATLPHHVLDLSHQPHDLAVYSKTLIPPEQLSPDALANPDEFDLGGGG